MRLALVLAACAVFFGGSVFPPGGLLSGVRALTRPDEFDYGSWTLDAIGVKFADWGLSLSKFIPADKQSHIVLDTLAQTARVNALSAQVMLVYADPQVEDPLAASQALRAELQTEQRRLDSLSRLADAILQSQLHVVLRESGLALLGQVLPPSLVRVSDVPYSLVVSPREEIAQVMDVPLLPGTSVEEMEALESQVFSNLDYSALVVPIGGVGTYPTMIRQTTDVVWLTEVISHEWVHNYLTLRPLGINYYTNDALRTINETTANLAGKELGRLILEKYYPEYVSPEPDPVLDESQTTQVEPEPDPDVFDFRKEMRITRLEVDRLLAEGEIAQAEAYMEARRQVFWENGYLIRKLNQAYFAFYGAYNDEPGGGAAGEDPVGPAVVALRDQFDALADFLNTIARVSSYQRLLDLLAG